MSEHTLTIIGTPEAAKAAADAVEQSMRQSRDTTPVARQISTLNGVREVVLTYRTGAMKP